MPAPNTANEGARETRTRLMAFLGRELDSPETRVMSAHTMIHRVQGFIHGAYGDEREHSPGMAERSTMNPAGVLGRKTGKRK